MDDMIAGYFAGLLFGLGIGVGITTLALSVDQPQTVCEVASTS